jgi:hypothetical protein
MGYESQIAFALILGIPVACITWTFTQEELFHEVRRFLGQYQIAPERRWWQKKLAYLPTCPFCSSHYVAAVFIALLHFRMLRDDWRGYCVSLFSLVLIANVYITVYHLLRAALRWTRAAADYAEKRALGIRAASPSIALQREHPIPAPQCPGCGGHAPVVRRKASDKRPMERQVPWSARRPAVSKASR